MTQKTLLNKTSLTKASHYLLTATDVFTNSHTVTIAGVVFTFVTALSSGPAVAGQIKIGSAAANLEHLRRVISNPAQATDIDYTAISAANQAVLVALKLTAETSATVLTVYNQYMNTIVVSETLTNVAWSRYSYSTELPIGNTGASVQFVAEVTTSGNGVLTVEVSNDSVNWVAYNRLISNVTNSNSQTNTRVASSTLSSNTNVVLFLSSEDRMSSFRVKVVPSTDGEYSVIAAY